MTAIEWTQRPGTKGETWNPVVGCTPVSPGCLNCYAATMARRLEAMGKAEYLPRVDDWAEARPGEGALELEARTGNAPRILRIAELKSGRAVFTGEVRTLPGRLAEPLGWKRPRTVFVNSMSDLFHEAVPFEFIDQVFAVMALCPRHTFLVLTKRPERMAEYLGAGGSPGRSSAVFQAQIDAATAYDLDTTRPGRRYPTEFKKPMQCDWPLPNVWLGASVEHQAAADERIPHLLKCPAAVRFLSCEPLLGVLNIGRWLGKPLFYCPGCGKEKRRPNCAACGTVDNTPSNCIRGVDWVIAGGESGPRSRPHNIGWSRYLSDQCKAAGVPFFMKQLGARVTCANDQVSDWLDACGIALDDVSTEGVVMQGDPVRVRLADRKGGDPDEWPEDLRVREWPREQHTANSTQHTGGVA